jgi:hypothetical protein
MAVTLVITVTNNNEQRTMNYSKQTQSKPNKLEANLAEIPTGELLGILKPGTNQTQFYPPLADLSADLSGVAHLSGVATTKTEAKSEALAKQGSAFRRRGVPNASVDEVKGYRRCFIRLQRIKLFVYF